MAQELKLIPREPNYFNPFTEEAKRLVREMFVAKTIVASENPKENDERSL